MVVEWVRKTLQSEINITKRDEKVKKKEEVSNGIYQSSCLVHVYLDPPMLFGLVPLSAPSTRPDIFPHERFTVGWCGAYRVIKNRQGYGHRASFLHFSERCVCKTFKII